MPTLQPGASDAGALWALVRETSAKAVERGALEHIDTVSTTVEDGGVAFIVRRVAALGRKPSKPRGGRNPFLPPEPDLFVANVSSTHFAVLNKYNVLDHHLLVLTREYVDQEVLLDRADFEALAVCMQGADTLGFYNGGRVAGASQPHKHLQVVPLPLAAGGSGIPIEAVLGDGASRLPFRAALAWLEQAGDPDTRARRLLERYRELLDRCGVGHAWRDGREWQSQPYNLLVASSWMLLVPRSREGVAGIEVNALGFAGSLFVADEERLRAVERLGPMNVLRGVAVT